MIGHLWPKLDMERYSNVSEHMLPDPCSRNMNPLSPDTGRTVTSQTGLNSVKSYNHNSPNIWVEILVDSIFSWFGSKSNFFVWIQMAPAPRILYLGRKGKCSIGPCGIFQVWMFQPKKILPGNGPGNLNCGNYNIILMMKDLLRNINLLVWNKWNQWYLSCGIFSPCYNPNDHKYLGALRATVTLPYIPVMNPGVYNMGHLRHFLGSVEVLLYV